MARKQQKSAMEEELEAFSRGKTCTPEDNGKRIIQLVKKHAKEISKTKRQYLDQEDSELYKTYANIEAAFDILMDDLEKEGLLNV